MVIAGESGNKDGWARPVFPLSSRGSGCLLRQWYMLKIFWFFKQVLTVPECLNGDNGACLTYYCESQVVNAAQASSRMWQIVHAC